MPIIYEKDEKKLVFTGKMGDFGVESLADGRGEGFFKMVLFITVPK